MNASPGSPPNLAKTKRELFWEAVAFDRAVLAPGGSGNIRRDLADLVSRCSHLLSRLDRDEDHEPDTDELRLGVLTLLASAAAKLAFIDDAAAPFWVGLAIEQGERGLSGAHRLPPSHATQGALRRLVNTLTPLGFVATDPNGTALKDVLTRLARQIDEGSEALRADDDRGLDALGRALFWEAAAEEMPASRDRLLLLRQAESCYGEAADAFARTGNATFYLRADDGRSRLVSEQIIPCEGEILAGLPPGDGIRDPRCVRCNSINAGPQSACLRCGEPIPRAAPSPVATVTPAVPPLAPEHPCQACGRPLRPADHFCRFCGNAAEPARCAACGAELRPGARFCGCCGSRFA